MEIRTDVPVPQDVEKLSRRTGLMNTLRKLEIGHSFFLPGPAAQQKAHWGAKRIGIKVTTQTESEGAMVWRIR